MKRPLILAALLIILDQATKFFFQDRSIEVTSFFNFIYVENTGAAFGMLKGFNLLFIIISIVVIAITLHYLKRYPIPLSLILAGTIGNFIDRLVFGFVRDFISVSIWPVFNLADAFNTIGVILLIYAFYREDKTYKRRRPRK